MRLGCSLIGAACVFAMGCGGDDSSPATSTTGAGGAGAGGNGAGGGALPAGYECVGSVELATAGEPSLDMTIALTAVPTQTLAAGLTLSACKRADVGTCDVVATAVTDAEGVATLTLPMGTHGFEGYGAVTGPAVVPGLIDASVPIIPVAGRHYEYPVYDEATLVNLLQQVFGLAWDQSKGIVSVLVNDCDGKLGAGVTITVEGAESVLYAKNGALVPDAKSTPAGGGALALNVPPGAVTITGKLEGTDVVVGTAKAAVRAGAFTTYFLLPTP